MATVYQLLGYLLEPLLFAAPYPYLAFYPTSSAARHVRSVNLAVSEDAQISGTMAQKPDTSLLAVMYPTKGILLWLIWSFPKHLADTYLAKSLPVSLTKYITAIVFAPIQLLWIQASLSDAPSSLQGLLRYIRSIAVVQWLYFIATVLAFCLIEEIAELIIEQSFKICVSRWDVSKELDVSGSKLMGLILMAHFFVSKAVKLFLWAPATVATVQAAPDVPDREPYRSSHEFYVGMMDCMKSIPLSLWYRFSIYYSVVVVIGISSRVADSALAVNITYTIPGDKL